METENKDRKERELLTDIVAFMHSELIKAKRKERMLRGALRAAYRELGVEGDFEETWGKEEAGDE